MNIIREEKPGYLTLLLRKSTKVKTLETVAFLFLIIFLSLVFGYDHPSFKLWAISGALISIGLSPIIYKIFINPIYILTEIELIIKKSTEETNISLFKIKAAHDVRYFYLIEGKKTALSVSNEFLDDLNSQLEKIKKK